MLTTIPFDGEGEKALDANYAVDFTSLLFIFHFIICNEFSFAKDGNPVRKVRNF